MRSTKTLRSDAGLRRHYLPSPTLPPPLLLLLDRPPRKKAQCDPDLPPLSLSATAKEGSQDESTHRDSEDGSVLATIAFAVSGRS